MTTAAEKEDRERVLADLMRAGISRDDAIILRRAARTLHRWHELECGTERGLIERDEDTGLTWMVNSAGTKFRTPDMETGALLRILSVVMHYPGVSYFVQGDPRGAALYILRPGDIPAGETKAANYTRGIAVY